MRQPHQGRALPRPKVHNGRGSALVGGHRSRGDSRLPSWLSAELPEIALRDARLRLDFASSCSQKPEKSSSGSEGDEVTEVDAPQSVSDRPGVGISGHKRDRNDHACEEGHQRLPPGALENAVPPVKLRGLGIASTAASIPEEIDT